MPPPVSRRFDYAQSERFESVAIPKVIVVRTGTLVLSPCLYRFGSVRCCFHTCGNALIGAIETMKKGENMKKLTLSFWLALAAAGIIVVQNVAPKTSQVRTDLPLPTCPPDCPDTK